jgi:uncharacterized protein with NRDE domain
LGNEAIYPEKELPQTGVSPEWESMLSALCVKAPGYASRVSTVITWDYAGKMTFWEKNLQSGELKKSETAEE